MKKLTTDTEIFFGGQTKFRNRHNRLFIQVRTSTVCMSYIVWNQFL